MNIKNIILVFLLGAGLSLYAHAEGIDSSLETSEKSKDNSIILGLEDNPYMRLTDEHTGDFINVWISRSSGETIYHVDYPWIVRFPKRLEMPIQVEEIPNAPEVEGGYYLYVGCYLASAPQCSVDQVEKELAKRGIEHPHVQPILPRKVILRCPSISGIQFIGINNDNDVYVDKDSFSTLAGLTIAVPARDRGIFESVYEIGNFDLVLEKIIAFTYQGSMAVQFNDGMKKQFLKSLTKVSNGAEYVTREDVVDAISDLSRSRQTDFYMGSDLEAELLEWIKNDFNKFIDSQELKIFFRTLDGIKAIENILVNNSKIERDEIVNLWNTLKEFEEKNGRALTTAERKKLTSSDSSGFNLGITVPISVGLGDSAKEVINGDIYTCEDTTHTDSTYKLREGDEIVITAVGLNLVHTNKVQAMLKEDYTFKSSPKWSRVNRTFTTVPRLLPDHGIVSTVKLMPNGEEIECKNGIAIIDSKNDFSYVCVTYFDGEKEIYSRSQLAPDVNKYFGTIMLKYSQSIDPDANREISSSVILKDMLYSSMFYRNFKERQKQDFSGRVSEFLEMSE